MTTVLLAALVLSGAAPTTVEVVRSYDAPEATQGVAVDPEYFYAITNKRIGKYRKDNGAKVASFEDPADGPFLHLNGGVIHDGKLYGFHSNFPGVPMVSSIEVFETGTLKHLQSIPLGVTRGSLVWALPLDGGWIACFGHYNERGGEPGTGNAFSRIDLLDKDFRPRGGFGFSGKIVERWDGMTCSGATFLPNGELLSTGHHAPELHRLRLPKAGGVVELVEVIPSPCEGQGLAYDADSETVWQIQRKERKVYQLKLKSGERR